MTPLRNLFRALTVAPIDEEVGRRAGAYLQRYRRSHGRRSRRRLDRRERVANNAELWTRNRKHYPMGEISFFEAVAD